jgi:hypothetical protein
MTDTKNKSKISKQGYQNFVSEVLKNRLMLSIGTKGSGKSYLMLNFLRYCFAHKLYERYVLILPSFRYEQHDSYSFINAEDKNIFVIESYNEVITANLLKEQMNTMKRIKTLFIIDDASGQDVWHIDDSLRKLITVIRHLEMTLWIMVHSATGILPPFLRQQTDMLLLSRFTNMKLLQSIHEEYLSLTDEYRGVEGKRKLGNNFLRIHDKPFQVIFVNTQENYVDFTAGDWTFDLAKKKVK